MTRFSAKFITSLCLVPLVFVPALLVADTSVDLVWQDIPEESFSPVGERPIVPTRYRTVALDHAALESILYRAPMEQSAAAILSDVMLSIPLPEGGYSSFRIVEAPIMAAELADRFPEIRTYRGQGIDDPSATLRFSVTPRGFHGQILSSEGRIYLDPHSVGDQDHLISYFTRDLEATDGLDRQCQFEDPHPPAPLDLYQPDGTAIDLRIYRLALAATGEYTAFHGGTVPAALAAQVTAMNRINGVYETELALRMEIIANNDQIIYTDPDTDPYSNNSGGAMLGQNQSNLDAVIGDANYDIGHVFSTGGGGVASLGVPCRSGLKARGVTGLPSPVGDVFFIDFVAHEMGHQWGGNHTFNGSSGACSGGNRNGSTAYEPGSGSTIQAYAGICSGQNLQSNSDAYFHAISLDEMAAYSRVGSGNNCPSTMQVENQPPVVTADQDFSIPLETPFELCGSATDADIADQDALTYNWEEWDLGPAGHPDSPSGNAPIFRSFWATPTGSRVFPRWEDLLNNTHTIGEILPSYARTLNFRLTARDNRSVAGAFGDNMNGGTPEVQISVADDSGPFTMTAPNGGGAWTAGTTEAVTWDVAGTNSGAVSCSHVDILLSVDGGFHYPVVLASSTSNDGAQTIYVPTVSTSEARVMIRCADNIFFDVSNGDFPINGTNQWVFGTSFDECNGLRLWDETVP